ncbi:alpha/beta hydrolase [Oryzihumus sp.]|uniref:alpha/beta hydrolase n=1 Tax=Oryzihumus sp. TaxID=1968903 RepID=UPI002ED7B664
MKRLTIVVTAAVAAGTLAATPVGLAAASPGTRTSTVAAATSVAWGSCSDPTLQQAHAQCGTVTVPMDYAHPGGAKVRLAVSRVLHTVPASQYQGVMLVNPGGPGGSGLIYSILGSFVPGGAGNAYDWIGFDPRGVGSSRPALSCDPTYAAGPRPPYDPVSHGTVNAWLARAAAYATACGRAGGALLEHLTTVDSAKDMDSIRAALGARKLNFYGFSYGTYLGQVYATLFPDKVRRFVLDSNVDPRGVWYQDNLDQDYAFEVVLTKFFGWIAKYDATYHLGTTEHAVEQQWYDAKDKLQATPAGGVVGAAEWTDIFTGAGYVQFLWPNLASLFSGWVHTPNSKTLVDAYNGSASVGDDNGYAMYLGVQCVDAPWPQKWSVWKRDNTRVAKDAPFLTWSNAWFNEPCRVWPAAAHDAVHVNGRDVPPILLVDETLDAATPYPGSLEVRRRFPEASLIALPGGTNHAFSLSGNTCLDSKIAAYLRDGTLPHRTSGSQADATCAPLPQPVPSSASAPTSTGGATRPPMRARLAVPR